MLSEFTARITPLGKDRLVRLWLPDDLARGGGPYPVVYMFDGHNLFRDEWATYGTCWGLADFLRRWEKQVIVVAPECDKQGNGRLREYSPYDMELPPFGFFRGQGRRVMEWILGELKPYIDRTYPTMPFRETTAIAGSSMGGLMSMFAVLRYNTWISKAACLSSSFRFCPDQITQEAENAQIDPDTRVYLSWGSREYDSAEELAAATACNLHLSHILTEQGARTYPYLHVDGRHCEADWAEEVPRFMHYLWME